MTKKEFALKYREIEKAYYKDNQIDYFTYANELDTLVSDYLGGLYA